MAELTDTVVLIEDQQVIAATVAYLVESCGASVETASDIQTGLTLVCRVRPKVILLDVELPDGSGADLCRAIRSEATISGAAIFFLSTHGPDALRAMAEYAGADGYLCKPFDPEQLLDLVRASLATNEPVTAAAP